MLRFLVTKITEKEMIYLYDICSNRLDTGRSVYVWSYRNLHLIVLKCLKEFCNTSTKRSKKKNRVGDSNHYHTKYAPGTVKKKITT